MVASTLHAETEKFLAHGPVPLYIGGVWRPARQGGVFDVYQPADGVALAQVAAGDGADIDDAVTAADRAFPAWSSYRLPTGPPCSTVTQMPSRPTWTFWPAWSRWT